MLRFSYKKQLRVSVLEPGLPLFSFARGASVGSAVERKEQLKAIRVVY